MVKVIFSIVRFIFWGVVVSPLAFAEWETLENCRLVSSSKNDGDSFVVEHDGEIYTFRLYFVDTPETGLFYYDRVADQAKYFSTDVDDMLRIGKKSEDFSRRFLTGRFTVHTQWSDAMGQGKRYAAVLYNKRGESLIETLVSRGYARIKGFTPGSAWPDGKDSDDYKRLLAKLEKKAKRDKEGAWHQSDGESEAYRDEYSSSKDPQIASEALENSGESESGLIDLNKASAIELTELPGIGPTYANRIIESRPFLEIDDLLKVRGVGSATLQRLKPLVAVSLPERFNETARYYLREPSRWANQEVQLRVAGLAPLDIETPEGFVAFTAATGSSETIGGPLRLYMPKARTNDALSYFQRTSEPVRLSVFFFEHEGEWVTVLRAN